MDINASPARLYWACACVCVCVCGGIGNGRALVGGGAGAAAAADCKWAAIRESSSAMRRCDDIMSSKGSLLPPKGHPKDGKEDRPNGNGREKKSSLKKGWLKGSGRRPRDEDAPKAS